MDCILANSKLMKGELLRFKEAVLSFSDQRGSVRVSTTWLCLSWFKQCGRGIKAEKVLGSLLATAEVLALCDRSTEYA